MIHRLKLTSAARLQLYHAEQKLRGGTLLQNAENLLHELLRFACGFSHEWSFHPRLLPHMAVTSMGHGARQAR